MYTVVVEGSFSATHRVADARGDLEPLHGHDWGVRAVFRAERLNDQRMVIDFLPARRTLREVLTPLQYACLNDLPAFENTSPTAEEVARCIFEELQARGLPHLHAVHVTEAPGCVAGYSPDLSPDSMV